MYLKKLEEKRALAQEKMKNMLDLVEKEERALTEEEQAEFDNIEKQVRELAESVERFKSGRELEKEEDVKEDEKETEERAINNEEVETRSFANHIRNIVEKRSDNNLVSGSNGAIIPTTIAQKIISKVYDVSPILEKATKYNTKGDLEIPVYGADGSNDINMAYATEFTDLESNIGKFTSVSLTGFLAGALTKLSNSLINNTDIDLVNKVIELMADTILRFMEKELLIGTTSKVTGCSGITEGITTAASTVFTADELIKLKNSIKKVYRKNSIWIMSNETLTAIELLKDTTGRYLFTEDLTGEYDGKILGYPVYVSDNMPEIAASAVPILFGDFSAIALKQTQELEMQILREKYATQHATGIVAWTEFDAKIENTQKLSKMTMKAST